MNTAQNLHLQLEETKRKLEELDESNQSQRRHSDAKRKSPAVNMAASETTPMDDVNAMKFREQVAKVFEAYKLQKLSSQVKKQNGWVRHAPVLLR